MFERAPGLFERLFTALVIGTVFSACGRAPARAQANAPGTSVAPAAPTMPALEFEETAVDRERNSLKVHLRYPTFRHPSPVATKVLNEVLVPLVRDYEKTFAEAAASSSGEISLTCEVTVATPAIAGFVCFGWTSVSTGESSDGEGGGAPGGPNLFAHLLAIDGDVVRELGVADIVNDGNLSRLHAQCVASGDDALVCRFGVKPLILLLTADGVRLYREDWAEHFDVPFDEVPGGVRAGVLRRVGWSRDPE